MQHDQALSMLCRHRLVAILRGIPEEASLPVAQALHRGGIRVLEFTFDHDLADYMALTARQVASVRRAFGDEMVVGCGTVLSEEEVRAGHDAGAMLIVSPNVRQNVIHLTRQLGMISMPGALTPTEITDAWEAGADVVKLFPAGVFGPGYIKAVRAPLRHIPMSAVGGVKPENVAQFLDAGVIGFGVGSEMVSADMVARRNWQAITDRACAFVNAIADWEAAHA